MGAKELRADFNEVAQAAVWSKILGRPVAAVYGGVPIIEVEEIDMGTKELRAAFNEVAQPAATCLKALLEYEQASDTEFQRLYFSGNYADGSGFVVKSDRIRPGADVNMMARATAEQMLQHKGAT